MNFTATPMCQQKAQCFNCRTNEQFRKQMEANYGPWECPENIPIGATLEQLPQESQDMHNRMIKAQEDRKQKMLEMQIIFDELEMMIDGEAFDKLEKIKIFIFPQSKKAEFCTNGGEKVGEVDQECCCGKIKKVDVYKCTEHMIATDKKCATCDNFTTRQK